MSTLNLRLPDSLHEKVKTIAKSEGISINQFISSAVAEKMSALLTEEYLAQGAKQGKEKSFFEAMSKVPDTDPDREDGL